MTQSSFLTLIVPTLNPASYVRGRWADHKVALGNLIDNTIIATADDIPTPKNLPEKVEITTARKGRGTQLKAGAEAATGEWFLFLHTDTHLSDQANNAISSFTCDPANKKRLGYFRFRLDDVSEEARKLEARVAWRCHKFALPYGDQGFLISRAFYEELGGFRALPLMEDVDLVWRIERKFSKTRIVPLEADAITSAEKFIRDGYFWRSSKNLFCLFLFWIKVPAKLIAKIY